MRIDELARSERIVAVGAFDGESEPLIECECWGIVGIDGEFEALQSHPVVGGVEQGGHQGGADALSGPGIVHAHADAAGVGAAAGESVEDGAADDGFLDFGQDMGDAGGVFVESGLDVFGGLERHLCGAPAEAWLVEQFGEAFGVGGAGGAEFQASGGIFHDGSPVGPERGDRLGPCRCRQGWGGLRR